MQIYGNMIDALRSIAGIYEATAYDVYRRDAICMYIPAVLM